MAGSIGNLLLRITNEPSNFSSMFSSSCYHLDYDETKFIENSYPNFKAHRHSQSVLSILAKKINCDFISAYESEWALDDKDQRTFDHLENYQKKCHFRSHY